MAPRASFKAATLPPRAAPQLPIDPLRLVALGAEDLQTAQLRHTERFVGTGETQLLRGLAGRTCHQEFNGVL